VGTELYWRNKGFNASVLDDKDLWSYWRSKVYADNGSKNLVILGASRAQLGLNPEVIKECLSDYNIVMLAVNGKNPYAILKDLAYDEDFTGVILCAVNTPWLIDIEGWSAQEWCDYYNLTWKGLSKYGKLTETLLRAIFQQSFAILNPNLGLKRQLYYMFNLKPLYLFMYKNRYKPAFYYSRMAKEELEKHRQGRIERTHAFYKKIPIFTSGEFYDHLETEIKPLIHKIKSRKGEVIFLFMPVDILTTLNEDGSEYHPKNMYWNKIAHYTGARTIHFKDYKELSVFKSPDASHLDAHDAKTFTANLCKILQIHLL
jgi:hypothetical protein